jgi:very-short-patch-repair endonuclease
MANCESPIEQIMMLKIHEFMYDHRYWRMFYVDKIDVIDPHVQYEETIKGNKYRVDILIPVWDNITHEGTSFIIECDGHDFHEKTKEQARRDKKRDRDLTTAGNIIMRFTGSEICNNDTLIDEMFNDIREIILQRRKQMGAGTIWPVKA